MNWYTKVHEIEDFPSDFHKRIIYTVQTNAICIVVQLHATKVLTRILYRRIEKK